MDIVQEIIANVTKKSNAALEVELKHCMVERHLNVTQIRRVKLAHSQDEYFVDLKKHEIFLRRKIVQEKPFGFSIVLEKCSEPLGEDIMNIILTNEKPDMNWIDNPNFSSYIPYNEEHDFVRINYNFKSKSWVINIVGVERFHEKNFGIDDMDKVKLITEKRIKEVIDKMSEIITRSNG